MKEKTIKWDKDRGSFLGRNGLFKCRGVRITSNDNDLYLEPLTSQGHVGRCLICIPIDHAPNLLTALKGTL